MRPNQLDSQLRERLDALDPDPRAQLLHLLHLPDLDWAEQIGEFWGHPETRSFGEPRHGEKPPEPEGSSGFSGRRRTRSARVGS
jgi:hypothetical protein